jgi:hypothetical protein
MRAGRMRCGPYTGAPGGRESADRAAPTPTHRAAGRAPDPHGPYTDAPGGQESPRPARAG